MRYKRTLILLAMTVACCIGIFVMTGRQKNMSNIVLQNDIAETVKENMNDLAVLEEKFPDTDILVFDTEGFCIYPGGEDLTLTQSRNNGDLCLAVTDGDRFLATAAIPDPSYSEYNKAFGQLTCAAVILFLIMVTAAVSFYLYIVRNILKPFRRISSMAISQARFTALLSSLPFRRNCCQKHKLRTVCGEKLSIIQETGVYEYLRALS